MTGPPDKTPDRIAGMFDAIAPRYDLLNHVLSAGIDRRWRAKAIESLALDRPRDAARRLHRHGGCGAPGTEGWTWRPTAARVIGVDFAGAMLAFGRRKVRDAGEERRIALLRGDAANLPVRDASVDAATVAFGIRNVQRPERACAEMARALRRGGRLAILEFGVPRIPGISTLYLWYFKHLLPRVGRMVSGHGGLFLPAGVSRQLSAARLRS